MITATLGLKGMAAPVESFHSYFFGRYYEAWA
jgi:hypothetical protein